MSGSADNVSYNFGASGAVSRNVAQRLRDIPTIKDFGAVGNGTTDDTAALQAAAAYLDGLTNGGTIYFPPGDYLVTSMVTFKGDGVRLLGSWPATRIINGTSSSPAISLGDGGGPYNRCSIEGFVFSQRANISPQQGNCGLRILRQNNACLRDIECYPYPAALRQGIIIDGFVAGELLNVNAQNCTDVGIFIANGLDVHAFHLRSDANRLGFEIVDSEGMYIVNATAFGNAEEGWRVRTGPRVASYHHFYTNCVGDSNGTYNWQISGLKRSTFTGCWGATQKSTATATYASGFILVGSGCEDILFNGCWAITNNSHGFHLYRDPGSGTSPRNIILDGCMAGQLAVPGTSNGRSGSGYGIYVDVGCSAVNVVGGQGRGNTSGAIYIAAGADCQVTAFGGI